MKWPLIILLFLVSIACTPKLTPVPAPAQVEVAPAPISPVREAWEEKWVRWVSAAKKEGNVTIYSTFDPESRKSLSDTFKQKYGIRVEFTSGRGSEMAQKLLAESRAGLAISDINTGGSTTHIVTTKPAGVLQPLEQVPILPEVVNPEFWWGSGLRWIDREHYALAFSAYPSPSIGINTGQVNSGEIKSYQDLLNPKWKSKITVNDPTVDGSGNKWFSVVGESITGWDYMRKFAKQEPIIVRNERLQVEWLAQGKYPIAIKPIKAVVQEFQQIGAPLQLINMAEGEYLSSGKGILTLIKGAPHPNAAKVFINWLLTKDVQTLYSKVSGYQSARLDVPTDFIDPVATRVSGVKYINSDDEDSILRSTEYDKLALEIFGPLIK